MQLTFDNISTYLSNTITLASQQGWRDALWAAFWDGNFEQPETDLHTEDDNDFVCANQNLPDDPTHSTLMPRNRFLTLELFVLKGWLPRILQEDVKWSPDIAPDNDRITDCYIKLAKTDISSCPKAAIAYFLKMSITRQKLALWLQFKHLPIPDDLQCDIPQPDQNPKCETPAPALTPDDQIKPEQVGPPGPSKRNMTSILEKLCERIDNGTVIRGNCSDEALWLKAWADENLGEGTRALGTIRNAISHTYNEQNLNKPKKTKH
ncbi:hypothetical protein V5T82_04485 [Magnetovibrio sp. PR-2]|uniref:hypothetical protein n=1 Tax=Magnetovibrio sp. PR-2 TaxID=3120356 RepID=UPI002FCDE6F3